MAVRAGELKGRRVTPVGGGPSAPSGPPAGRDHQLGRSRARRAERLRSPSGASGSPPAWVRAVRSARAREPGDRRRSALRSWACSLLRPFAIGWCSRGRSRPAASRYSAGLVLPAHPRLIRVRADGVGRFGPCATGSSRPILGCVTPGRDVVPLRVGLTLAAVAILLLALAWGGDTRPWPDGVATTGRVVQVESRWSRDGGSALVAYRVRGTAYERWLPDVTEQGRVGAGDPYLLEYKTEDPTAARGVAANRDDSRFLPITYWSGLIAAFLAVAAVAARWLGRDQPGSPPTPAPRRSR